jgi:hypothetical protein
MCRLPMLPFEVDFLKDFYWNVNNVFVKLGGL